MTGLGPLLMHRQRWVDYILNVIDYRLHWKINRSRLQITITDYFKNFCGLQITDLNHLSNSELQITITVIGLLQLHQITDYEIVG